MSNSFTDGEPRMVTEKDLMLPWAGKRDGSNFRCGLCGHRFREGDYYRWQYTNDIPKAGGNPFICALCDDPDRNVVRQKWQDRCRQWDEFINDPKFWMFKKNLEGDR